MAKAHRIALGGVTFIPHSTGALFAPEFKTLLVSDLHLESGTAMARRGVHVPPYDTSMTLQLLERVVSDTMPWRMVLLGDTFHDRVAHGLIDDGSRARLIALTATLETVWISGNHDPDPPQGLGGIALKSHQLGPVTLRHEPSRNCEFEIAGHLHPGATVVQRGIATRAKCFVADGKRLIMPAFGAYTGAISVRSRAFANLFEDASTYVWMIGRNALHRFPMQRVE
jgi:uncharacterized protein